MEDSKLEHPGPPQNQSTSLQTERTVDDKAVQTEVDLDMKANPLSVDDDDDPLNDYGAISEDENMEPELSMPDMTSFSLKRHLRNLKNSTITLMSQIPDTMISTKCSFSHKSLGFGGWQVGIQRVEV